MTEKGFGTLPWMQLNFVFCEQDETLRKVTLNSNAVNKQSRTIEKFNQSLQSFQIALNRSPIKPHVSYHMTSVDRRNPREAGVWLAAHKLAA